MALEGTILTFKFMILRMHAIDRSRITTNQIPQKLSVDKYSMQTKQTSYSQLPPYEYISKFSNVTLQFQCMFTLNITVIFQKKGSKTRHLLCKKCTKNS